jgi:hypothetical protein
LEVSSLYATLDDGDSRQHLKATDRGSFSVLVCPNRRRRRPDTFSNLDQEIQRQELTFARYVRHRKAAQCLDVGVLSTCDFKRIFRSQQNKTTQTIRKDTSINPNGTV